MTEIGRKFRLVVVDDDAFMVQLVERFLQEGLGERLEITSFTDPSQAKRAIQERGCDLLLSDIEMPKCTGLEILAVAKSRNTWTRIIFMTAHSTWDRVAEAIEQGAADYLLKPIDRQNLIQIVAQECDRLERWKAALRHTLQSSNPAN